MAGPGTARARRPAGCRPRAGRLALVAVAASVLSGLATLPATAQLTRPETPRDVTVRLGPATATVSWHPFLKSGVSYVVTSSPRGLGCVTSTADSCSFVVRNNTPYQFTVKAEVDGRISDPSLPTPVYPRRVLLIVAGSSNAEGQGARPIQGGVNFFAAPESNGADENSLITWVPWGVAAAAPGVQPMPLDTPQVAEFADVDHDVQVFGPEIGIARQLWADKSLAVTIVKAALPGSDLPNNWNPRRHGGPFDVMVSYVRRVMAYDAAHGQLDILGGLYWFQGLKDAVEGQGAGYGRRLSNFIVATRRDLPFTAGAPFVIAEESARAEIALAEKYDACPTGGCGQWVTGIAEVRAGDREAASRLYHVLIVDTTNLPRVTLQVHLSSLGEIELGEHMATVSEPDLP